MIASTINFFLPHTCQFMEMLLSSSLNSFISTILLTLSDQHLELSLIFLGLKILRRSDTVSEPSAVLLLPFGIPSLNVTETFSVMMLFVSTLLTFGDELVGALSPVNHEGSRQGWAQTARYLQVIHFTRHHTASHVSWAFLYSVGTQHGSLHPAGWPILFCGPTQDPVLATYKQRNPLVILREANWFQSFHNNFLRHHSTVPECGHGSGCSVYVLLTWWSKAKLQQNVYPPNPPESNMKSVYIKRSFTCIMQFSGRCPA